MSKLYILTVATKIDYYLPWLIESCKKNNNNLIILGLGMEWQGYNWRNKLILNFLKTINDNDIVCVIDGYDIICTRDLNELKTEFLKLYYKHNCKIITGSDTKFKYDIYGYMNHYLLMGMCNYNFLNAGTYIGHAKDLKYIINNIYNLNPNDNADDQELMTQYCSLNKEEFYIDTNNDIFFTFVYPLKELSELVEIKNNNVYYKNKKPFFVHANVCGLLNNIIIKLGYNITKKEIKDIYTKLKKNKNDKSKYYSNMLKYNNTKNKYYDNIQFIFLILFLLTLYFFMIMFIKLHLLYRS